MDGSDLPVRMRATPRHAGDPAGVDLVRAPLLNFKRRIKETLRDQIARGVDPAALRAVIDGDADEVAGNFPPGQRPGVRAMLAGVMDEVLSDPEGGA